MNHKYVESERRKIQMMIKLIQNHESVNEQDTTKTDYQSTKNKITNAKQIVARYTKNFGNDYNNTIIRQWKLL